ncbi:MAG: hypothetical protein RL336_788 [Pseudomonadota bacterium]|jgi:hypothetical protein
MNRRELLKMIAAVTGASLVGVDAMAYVEMPPATPLEKTGFNKDDYLLWEAICDAIMPRTDTPGAVDAGTPAFTLSFAYDCYTEEQMGVFKSGLADIRRRSLNEFGQPLSQLAADTRHSFLSRIDKEAIASNANNPEGEGAWAKVTRRHMPHYFTLMKQLTLFGFFTSEVGATQVLRYVSVPGRYDGDYPYQPGDKAWAPEY